MGPSRRSRRVVSRKVLGSANPVAKWGRGAKRTFFDSIGGFFLGLLLFFIPFGITYCAATQEKDSKDVAKLTEITAAETVGHSGKALVSGIVLPGNTLEPQFPVDEDKVVLAYDYKLERFEMHIETREETETKVENGQEVQYTYEVEKEVWDWELQTQDLKWAEVKLGPLTIDPDKCKFELPWVETFSREFTDIDNSKLRENQLVIWGDVQVLLATELADGRIVEDADFNRLTTQSKDELVATMDREEETARWFKLILAIIVMAVSFNLMLGPAMLLINIIPIKQLSGAIRGVLGFVSLVASAIIVLLTYFVFRFWWVILILVVAGAAIAITMMLKQRSPEADPNLDLAEDLEVPESD